MTGPRPYHLQGPQFAWTDERVEQLRAMHAQGMTAGEIAVVFGGITRNSVIGKQQRLGLTKSGQPLPKRRLQRKHRAIPMQQPIRRYLTHMPPQARAEPAEPVSETRCGIMELSDDRCRWPLGEPAHDMLYCGGRPVEGLPYCGHHCKIAYTPTSYRGAPGTQPG